MSKIFALLCLFYFIFPCCIYPHNPAKNGNKANLQINIFSHHNGKGLEADIKILKEALETLGQSVRCYDSHSCSDDITAADVNVFFEWITFKALPHAGLNWFVPNPEWYWHDLDLLDCIDLILCRTKEAVRIFNDLNRKTYYLGFTSSDCFQNQIKKDFDLFLHVAGGSEQKGTSAILEAWNRNEQFPPLTIIKQTGILTTNLANLIMIPYRISQKNLTYLQNRCGIHLCLSETEGFGHYILEGMSAGAVVLTTDAPPMNELISDPRCLVPYSYSTSQRLAINYYIDINQLENSVKLLAALSKEELELIGINNRKLYLQKKQDFFDNLKRLISLTLNDSNSK